jgi:hypothetical protein
MRRVDRKPDKPTEPNVGGHDPNRREAGAPSPDAPAAHDQSKPDKNIFDDERSDRSSGRPVQLEDQQPARRQTTRPKPDPGQKPGQERPGPPEPLTP